MSHPEAPQTESAAQKREAKPFVPTYVDFFYYKVNPAFRRLPEEERRKSVAEFRDALTALGKTLELRYYSTLGFTPQADFLIWAISKEPDRLQDAAPGIVRAGLGRWLDNPYTFLAVTKPTPYSKDHSQAFELGPSICKYLFVYPFIKTNEWYLLPFEERRAMMGEHRKVGGEFPKIRVNTTYSFGLGDQDFMLAFEGDDLKEFSDLVQRLRETKARLYTVRDTPFLIGSQKTLDELLQQLALV